MQGKQERLLEEKEREVVTGRKQNAEVCPCLRRFVGVTPDWRGGSMGRWLLCKKACLCFILLYWKDRANRRGGWESVWCSEGVITRRGAEGWEPNGYFILSIGVCKWKCQSSRKTNESDRRDATSLAECLINCHCLFCALMFFVVIFWLFSPPGLAACG